MLPVRDFPGTSTLQTHHLPFAGITTACPDISAGSAGQKNRQVHMPHVPGLTVCQKGKHVE